MASIAFGLACLGCLLLSLSLRRNYRRVFDDHDAYPLRAWPRRAAGYGCALLALCPCMRLSGLWMGLILWLSLFALAAFLQIMLLTYRPRSSAAFGCFGAALIAAGLLL